MAKKTTTKKAATKKAKKTATKKKTAKTKISPDVTKKEQLKNDNSSQKGVFIAIAIALLVIIGIALLYRNDTTVSQEKSIEEFRIVQNQPLVFSLESTGNRIQIQQETTNYLEFLCELNGIEPNEREIMQEIVLREILYFNAQEKGIEAVNTVSEEMFNQQLGGIGLTYQEFMQLYGNEINKDYVIQEYFNQEILRNVGTTEAKEASHILVCFQGTMFCEQNRTRENALQIINDIYAEIVQNPDAFDVYAQTASDDPSGGYLGVVERGMMVPEFEEALFSATEDLVAPFETDFGFHIIRVEDRIEIPDENSALGALDSLRRAILEATNLN